MQPSHLIRIAGTDIISLLLFIQSSAWTYHVPLNPGCITSGEQWLLIGTLPATVTATTAGDGTCSGNYKYQWQISTDNIYFTDIPGATGQNLSFTTSPTQSAWYQRKVTCGSEVGYTGTVKVNMVTTVYYNVVISGTFTRNNCTNGDIGSTITYTVPANTYSSLISQADANAKAQADVNANGQAYANSHAICPWHSVQKSGTFTRNNCPAGTVGTAEIYTVAAGTYSSFISQADADQKAQDDINANGQNYANTTGVCYNVFISKKSGSADVGYFFVYIRNSRGIVLYAGPFTDLKLPARFTIDINPTYTIEIGFVDLYITVNGVQKYAAGSTFWYVTSPIINIEVSQTP